MLKAARIAQVALIAIVTGVSCTETTRPKTIDPPIGLSALLISPTSARITWTASAQSERVTSYNVFRNGAKIAEVQTTSHVDEGLVELTSYAYTVSATGKDGITSAQSAESSSGTVTPPDVTAPRVTASTPAEGTAVPRATTLRATFSEAITPSTLNASTFLVRTSSGSDVSGTVTYLPATSTAEFVPAAMLPNAAGIAVTITTGVRDKAGNAMTAPFEFAFAVRDEIAPSVSSVTPADLATGVPVGMSAVIEFSEPMDAGTINPSSVTLRLTGTGAAVSGAVSYDTATRMATFIPASPLDPGSSYTLGVSSAVKDASSNALTPAFASSFVTAPGIPPPPPTVDVPPTVTSSTPANGSANVPVTSPVSVAFSKEMNTSTITASTFTLTVGGAPVSGTVNYDASSRVASFVPNGGLLAEGRSYVAKVTTYVWDVSGKALVSDFVFSFSTSSPTGNTPLAIVSRTPSPGATGVDRTTTVSVEFSKTMEAATIDGTTFTLSSGGFESQVAGSVTYDSGTRIATFTHNGPLNANRRYTATVTRGAKDAAGKTLGANDSFSFTTGFLPAAPEMAWLIGIVIDDSGLCIEGATVRVVRGQGAGQIVSQGTPCGVWQYGGGFEFENLIPGVEMTLQASAPGYSVYEKTVFPSLGPQMYVELVLSRDR
ncbi:MAG: Ig-like domain-containing protein [Gemmatimonadaceae bacterium]